MIMAQIGRLAMFRQLEVTISEKIISFSITISSLLDVYKFSGSAIFRTLGLEVRWRALKTKVVVWSPE